MIRGKYVTLTGHSNPEVDPYFDLQPGFFWTTAILLNIISTPQTPNSPIFEFLTKWFEILIATLYLIPLIYIMKSANVESLGLAMLIVYGINFSHLHYHAQAYADMLYWLLLSLLLSKTIERKTIFLIIILGTAIVFVHQGVALATLISTSSLASILILYEVLKRNSKASQYTMFLTLTLLMLVIWLAYLLYISKFHFPQFVSVVKNVITKYLLEPVQPIASAVNRPYKPWDEVVLLKALFMISIILSSILINLLSFTKSRELSYLSRTMIMVSVTALIGAIALAMGGAGYVERLIKWLAPLIAISLVNAKKMCGKGLSCMLIHLLLISAIVLGTTFYFTGRNFQSIPYSLIHLQYLDEHYEPYQEIRYYEYVVTASWYFQGRKTSFILISDQDLIQYLYYRAGELVALKSDLAKIINNSNVIFSTPSGMLCLIVLNG
ncbi:hypothetical protein [Thermofilum sp.]|uniref:hypothetical protein n=1 Tax=Thermofilum sp. TaxID=1961369 RepID=UPI0031696210